MQENEPFTSTQTFRHQCEVRYWLLAKTNKGRDKVKEQLEAIERQRGPVAFQRLKDDINQQWYLGNRGVPGVWLTEDSHQGGQNNAN